MSASSILVVDDEPNSLFGICQILTDEGYHVIPAGSAEAAMRALGSEVISLVITDERMPNMGGMELLAGVKKINPQIPVIFMTAYGSVSLAVEALKQGAYYFFEKPIIDNLEQFLAMTRQAIKVQEMERQLDHLRKEVSEKFSFPNIVGCHPKMLEVFEIISRVGPTDNTVLIQGESGTGKDLIAKAIHYSSLRKDKPLVIVNCGALTDTLLTSELFGHVRGAFTGAVKDKIGRFQMADGGTIVLDEISEIPLHLQKTLLRIIEEKEFERVGDARCFKVDVRIISTTNRILHEALAQGKFREDLYYRLSIVPLTLPALRDRATDIPLLIDHLLRKAAGKKSSFRIDPKALKYLTSYAWPGNVRELANVVQQMTLFTKRSSITVSDLPSRILLKEDSAPDGDGGKVQLKRMVSHLEKEWILKKLRESGWNQEKAAGLLGITRKMLTNRIAKYKLKPPKTKAPTGELVDLRAQQDPE